MDRFSALQLFVRVVDCGSFTQAARELGLGQSAVSKQVAALEAHLGTSLLKRTSRGLHTDFAPDPLPIQAVCAVERRMPQRLRLFVEFLADMCAAECPSR